MPVTFLTSEDEKKYARSVNGVEPDPETGDVKLAIPESSGGASAFVVTVNGNLEADKTNTEIYDAFVNKRTLYAVVNMDGTLVVGQPLFVGPDLALFVVNMGDVVYYARIENNVASAEQINLVTQEKLDEAIAGIDIPDSGGNVDQSGVANIYAGAEEPTDGSLVWIDTTEEDSSLELNAEKWVSGYWSAANGGLQGTGSADAGQMVCLTYVPVKAGKTYTIYSTDSDWTSNWIGVGLYEHDLGIGGHIQRVTGSGASITVTIPSNAAYLIFSSQNLVENDAYKTIRIVEDSVAPDTHAHSYTSKVTTAATCTTNGVKTYTCECGNTYTESIPATGHNYVDGVCSICGAKEPGGEVTTYTITNNLTNVTTNNPTASATEGNGYTATLTAADGYELDSVTVTMGGADVTSTAYSGGAVNIASVTGNVVITATAVAVEESEGVWKDGYVASNGSITVTTENGTMYYDKLVPVTPGGQIMLSNPDTDWYCDWGGVAMYSDAGNTFVSRASCNASKSQNRPLNTAIFDVPSTANYAIVSSRRMTDHYDTAVIHSGDYEPVLPFENTQWRGGQLNTSGEVNTTGATTGEGSMRSGLISVEPGATYRFANSNADWTSNWMACCLYSGAICQNTHIERKTSAGASWEITIPDNAKYICLTAQNLADYYTTATFEKIS